MPSSFCLCWWWWPWWRCLCVALAVTVVLGAGLVVVGLGVVVVVVVLVVVVVVVVDGVGRGLMGSKGKLNLGCGGAAGTFTNSSHFRPLGLWLALAWCSMYGLPLPLKKLTVLLVSAVD